MVNGIKSIIEDLKNNIKKEDVEKNIEFTINLLDSDVLPALAELSTIKVSKIQSNKTIASFGKMCGLRGNANSIFQGLHDFFKEATEVLHSIDVLVDKKFPSIVTEATVTGFTGSIIKIVTDLSSMSNFILDFVNYALAEDGAGKSTRIQVERVKNGMATFMDLFKAYNGSLKSIEKDLPNVSNEILNFDQPNLSMINILLGKTGKMIKLPVTSGFIGNPIYHIRMWMMDRDIEKYEANKDRKRTLELKVLALNMDKSADGVDLNKVNKQIEYYEEKIQDLEYKISKFESNR